MDIPPHVTPHFAGAKDAYQHGVMAGMNDNVERLTGQKPMSVGEFARAHLDQLNPKVSS
jgi:NAD(P)H dehydrogenase (quinone)